MKKATVIFALLTSYFANAQKCSDYFYMQNNKTIELTITNKKGKETGKINYHISNVNKSGNTTTATINSEMFDKNGKSMSKATNAVQCQNGALMMDMKMFIPSAQQEQMGDISASTADKVYLEYPSSMKEGDALKDANFAMDFKSSAGINGKVTVAMTNRKVEGKESVTTTAGTWDCFKITYHSKVIVKIGIGLPINADVTEWYAPGFGTVKTEANGGKTEVTAIK